MKPRPLIGECVCVRVRFATCPCTSWRGDLISARRLGRMDATLGPMVMKHPCCPFPPVYGDTEYALTRAVRQRAARNVPMVRGNGPCIQIPGGSQCPFLNTIHNPCSDT